MRIALIGILGLGLGCSSVPRGPAAASSSPAFRCSAQGGPSWTEYNSSHFLLDTDAPEGKAVALLQELETLRAADLIPTTPGQ